MFDVGHSTFYQRALQTGALTVENNVFTDSRDRTIIVKSEPGDDVVEYRKQSQVRYPGSLAYRLLCLLPLLRLLLLLLLILVRQFNAEDQEYDHE
jgi:hypothetical protein